MVENIVYGIHDMNISSLQLEYNFSTPRIQDFCILLVNVENETLSQLLKRRLKELNLTNSQFATLAGLSRSYIGNMINETAPTKSGQYNPEPETVGKIARAAQVSEIEILATLGYNVGDSIPKKPTNVREFFQILDHLGLDVRFEGGIEGLERLGEDQLQDLLDSTVAHASTKVRRLYEKM